jgi:Domain of unknown function (DUF5615)
MGSRFYKHTLLLDEGFPPRSYFPRLNQRFDVKHVKIDLKKIGLPDEEVHALAAAHKRLVVTYNTKDFKRLARKSPDTGVIGVSALMSYAHIDKKLTALLTKSTHNALYGTYTSITGETEL